MMKDILFLTLAEVIDIHSNQMSLYGGLPGIRDINLLSSAIAMPHASFHGEYLHNDIYEMAAAYAFHIGKNHPFADGNKRTALVSALVFLELHGISISDPQGNLYDAILYLSTGKLNKSEFASILRKLKD
jgi:death-on-curing protein